MTTTDHDSFEKNRHEARQSFTGKSLTDGQFEESWALAGVMERGIKTNGTFHEKLTDYAHAFARSEKFDAIKGETIIRDIFKARYGETMNRMREGLMKREAEVRESGHNLAFNHARNVEHLIQNGETMPFYKAYDRESAEFAQTLGITQAGAKSMMQEAYRAVEKRELYDVGKALEDKFHRPRMEAEKAAREAARDRSRTRSR
ncbi:MAG: hypothetical protein KDF64_19860 [Geminicoccaceae bacterium]|nr:hypothetical protein [Geminicoccaceae bacterium]